MSEHNRRFTGPVNLRTASVSDLMRVPLINDKKFAAQIHPAVKEGRVTSVDDLIYVKGIDLTKLDIMGPRLR